MLKPFHQRITKSVLTQCGFSKPATEFVAEASTWPDYYRWTEPAAHAQTPSSAQTEQDMNRERSNAVALFRSYQEKILHSPVPANLVWFGFALHWVQDLAAHQGRSNAEHALQVFLFWQNPDYLPKNYHAAEDLTLRYVHHLQTKLPADRWNHLVSAERPAHLSQQQKVAIVGHKDFSWTTLSVFSGEGFRYLVNMNPKKRIRWDVEKTLTEAFTAQ